MPVVERDRPGGQRQAQRQELELSDGAGRVHRAKWRARCWGDTLLLFFSFFTTYYTLYTIPTLTHSSHPTHRIVAAFALPLS